MGRLPSREDAKWREHVPDDHKCNCCNRGKDEVNFSVSIGTKLTPYYVRKTCHFCYNAQFRKEIIPKEVRRNRFREKFKQMKWEQNDIK